MTEETLVNTEQRMRKSVEVMHQELAGIRTGRATPALIDHLKINYAGTTLPLNQIAGISAPGPNQLIIQPWDRGSVDSIQKAIMASDLGLNPSSDGRVIRVNVPPLTEERRQDLIKVVRRRIEEGRIAVRNLRRDAMDGLKAQEKDKEISQDEQKRIQGQLQNLTDGFIGEIERVGRDKETEVMEV